MKKVLLALAGVILLAGLASQSWRLQPTSEDAIKILPLGDSITRGKTGRPAYRGVLWQLLQEAGCNVDFVGSRQRPLFFATYDPDHEAHWGWRTDQIAARLPNWLDDVPDLVLVHLGTNDVLQRIDTGVAIEQLEHIVQLLRERNPSVVVLFARLIPGWSSYRQQIDELNAAITAMVARQNTPVSPVYVIDMNTGYSVEWNYDGLHPGSQGVAWMAQRWFEALQPLLGENCRAIS